MFVCFDLFCFVFFCFGLFACLFVLLWFVCLPSKKNAIFAKSPWVMESFPFYGVSKPVHF